MCIYLLNGHPHVKTRVAEVGVTALAVAIPTVGELYFGAYNSGRVEANIARGRAFLSPPGPQVLLIDEAASEQFGRFKALLRRTGRPMMKGCFEYFDLSGCRCRTPGFLSAPRETSRVPSWSVTHPKAQGDCRGLPYHLPYSFYFAPDRQ